MTYIPLRVRAVDTAMAACVNDTGSFFFGGEQFLERLSSGELTRADVEFLKARGHIVEDEDQLGQAAHRYGVAQRLAVAGPLDYLILVPTLRCNLGCSYCQVSRVAERATGFDWTDETLAAVLAQIDALTSLRIKVEFQGGEPTLRPDLMRAVIERCERFPDREFVICTNLQAVDAELLELFDRPDVYISTSLDGAIETHQRQRTQTSEPTNAFYKNLSTIVDRYGPRKVSALPTVDPESPPDADQLIDAYRQIGLESIFLRPINYQGFARKRHRYAREQGGAWRDYYESFVGRIIARNWQDRSVVLEETYLSVALRRIFRPGQERHVDLRNPNPMGVDYIVVDYDGVVYPTDEARMLTRSGVVDLSIGTVTKGWDSERRSELNRCATNQLDPACVRCAYQPYCGRDLVDDLARYGRVDMPRHETEFCRRHLHLFDFIFRMIGSAEPAVLYSFSRWLRLPDTPTSFGEFWA